MQLTYSYSYSFFSDNSVQRGKGAMRLTPCEAPTRETRPDNYTGNSVPYSLQQVCGFFNFLVADYITLKVQETWPMINCPYPRRQEHLTIAGVITKVACSPEFWSGLVWRSNLRPPTRQSSALPTELTSWRCFLLNFT